ncbi:myb-like protein Q [Anopheles aquasalis]|uniref:myb-like protein Q n=1 Tax=Anopheles aquasalis TaxID=42839 RepID=UPI00215A6D6D|nr:myb-like protein Q [Anopheles aquasalis]
MASNGGTLHGVPQSGVTEQQQQQQHICSQCGLYFESVSSLQVHHMHYHQHDSMNRWDTQQAVVSTTIATTAVATTTTAATITTNGAPIPSSTTPTSSDTENNNHQASSDSSSGLKPVVLSPQHTTIAAAADSSDNQPPTPQPLSGDHPGTPGSYGAANAPPGGASPYQAQLGAAPGSGGGEMHYPTYIHPGYDPGSYYASGTGLDYGGGVLGASSLQPADYKSGSSVVSSARYHPYGASSNSSGSASATNGTSDGSAPAVVTSNGGAGAPVAGLSPHVVSSSNGGVTAVGSGSTATVTTVASTTSAGGGSPPNGSQQQQQGSHIPPTPSPSPIQCEKCGLVCESDEALNQHESTVHSGSTGSTDGVPQQEQNRQQEQQEMQSAPGNCYGGGPPYGGGGNGPATPQFIKEEAPASDILDLDSQKMVYTPTADGGLLPPMNSLHPLQSMQRHHPMMWPHHDPHNFMGPPAPLPPHPSSHVVGGAEMKHSAAAAAAAAAAYYHHPIKSEYSATPSIKSDYHLGGGGQYLGAAGPGLVKNEYSLAPTLAPPVAIAPQPTNPQSMKQYADEMHDNQLATSPSDFPSTTTPQESGSQYRTFEPATSSLPGPGPGPTKGTAWKSNEARRPKTYNCTACNKWFTSSGHLKRHYNTTLHKNAVKSSGQPDPATLPISVHHHPGRDPNYANKGRRGTGGAGGNGAVAPGAGGPGSQIQQPIQQPVPPPDPPRSPEYGSAPGAGGQHGQYASMSGGSGFPSVIGTPPHGGHQVVVSSNQSPGFHHAPYANGTASSNSSNNSNSNSASSTSSSTVPPNGVAGPSVQVSQPRGLQIYSNSSSSTSSLEPMEPPVTHTITTILTQPTTYTGMAIIQGTTSGSGSVSVSGVTTDCTSTRTDTTGTLTPPTMGQQQQQPPPQQPLPPHTTISSMEPYHLTHHHHPHHHPTMQPMHTICSPLTISTSIPSFQTILPEAPSYHPTIGNSPHPQQQQQQQQQDGQQQQQQWISADGTLMESSSSTLGSLGFPRCSGGAEMYQGDTAPPFSPNVPDQYQRPSSQGHEHHHQHQQQQQQQQQHHQLTTTSTTTTTIDDHKYTDYQLQQQQQQQQYQLQRVATPQHAATAPSISPAPCSPSVTSTAGGGRPSTAPPSDSISPVEIFRCDECDKVFNKSCYLTQHNKTFHSGDKPYKCHRCGKRFGCNATYEEHLAKHGGEKPFKCELCPKQFNHKTDLRRHMCLHSGSKPYACERCGKGFIRKDHMLKHAETHRRASMVNGQRRATIGGTKLKGSGGGGDGGKAHDQRESVDGMGSTVAIGIIGMDE